MGVPVSDIRLATSPFGNFVVHAAAGTGKTWLLTSRIIRLLLAGSAPGAILAITFTRKAAAEIQERLLSRLLLMAGSAEPDLDQQLDEIGSDIDSSTRDLARRLYEKVLTADQPLRITTFHAFCQELLQRFPLESGLPPGFQLIETTSEIEQRAWALLETEIRLNPDSPLAQAMDAFLQLTGSPIAAQSALMAFLAQRSDWWAFTEHQIDPVAYAHEYANGLFQTEIETPENNEACRASLTGSLARYLQLLGKHPTKTNLGSIVRIEQAMASAHPEALLALQAGLFQDSNGDRKGIKSSATLEKRLGPDGVTEFTKLHDAIASQLEQWQQQRLGSQNLARNTAWSTCGQALLNIFQSIKLQRGLLDFSDLEWRAYKLLTDTDQAQWVQYKLDQRIDHLLVDEFQDTNPTQWHLIYPLLDEMAAGQGDRHRSAFIVGDIKQSIYRFRRAAPDLFHHARNWLTLNMSAESASQQKSYRSSPAIIEFVNLLFDTTAEQEEGHYHLHDFAKHEAHFGNRWGRVEILPLIPRDESDTDATEPGLRNPLITPRNRLESVASRQHQAEASIIADRILGLISKPIVDNDAVRPMQFGDVMILLRSRTHASVYEDALRQANIPFSGAGKGGFLEAIEVQDILSLLRALISPFDNLSLATALRSPVFSCSNEDLALLAAGDAGWWRQRLSLVQEALPESHSLSRAYRLLENWQQQVDQIPVHDLLDRMYADANIVGRYLRSAPGYLRQRIEANLNFLLEQALEVDGGRYPGVSRFIETLSSSTGDEVAATAAGSDNRVRVMTIHGAKGLEAPVVFIADAARASHESSNSFNTIVDWPAGSSKPEHFLLVGKTALRDPVSLRLAEQQKEADKKEEANLLYVALTRAGQYLFLSGCEPKSGSRGWYGFISARLEAERARLEQDRNNFDIHFETPDDSTSGDPVFAFGYGVPERCNSSDEKPILHRIEIDSRLTRPLHRRPAGAIINPSSIDETILATQTQQDPAAGATARQRGVWTHRALELLATDGDRESLLNRFTREAETELESELLKDCWRQATAIVDNDGFSAFFNRSEYLDDFNEMPLLYFNGKDPVYGVVDRVVVTDDSVMVLDYKTHELATHENVGELALPYYSQMHFYGNGVAALWPQKKVALYLLFTACGEIVEVPYPADT